MKTINLVQLRKMINSGINQLINESDYINDLNVYPVPDGDTGLNLKLTLSKAVEAVENQEYQSISDFIKAFARNVLLNARGNSGTIISQIIKGWSVGLSEVQQEATIQDFINVMQASQISAYNSVSEPVEGTMLTTTRLINEGIQAHKEKFDSIQDFFKLVYYQAAEAVIKSPDLLPVLKENNTVDSGAYACFLFFKGILIELNVQPDEINLFSGVFNSDHDKLIKQKKENFHNKASFGYCCEFIIKLKAKVVPKQKNKLDYDEAEIKEELEKMSADSIVLIQEDNLLKIHAHVFHPYLFLKLGQKYGEFESVKIENMTNQFLEHTNMDFDQQEIDFEHKTAVFAVLPNNEILNFVKSKYKLDYFYSLENSSTLTRKELADFLANTKAQKIYVINSDKRIKNKLNKIDSLLLPNQSIELIKVRSLTAVLNLISYYDKNKAHWWNWKVLQTRAQSFSSYWIEDKKIGHKFFYMGMNKKEVLFQQAQGYAAILNLANTYIADKKRFMNSKYGFVILYNDSKLKESVQKLVEHLKAKLKMNVYNFYVSSQEEVLCVGLIKMKKSNQGEK